MKNYELIIETKQPTCGGKSPKDVKLLMVAADDPMAYVRSMEPEGELTMETSPKGEIIISLDQGLLHKTYTFTED